MCMEDLLPSLSVLLRCLRCVNFLQKNKRELSEYKAIGMIQDHVSLLYQDTEKHPKSNKDFNPFVRPPTEEWTEISSIRRNYLLDIMGVVYEYNGFGKQKKAA